MRHALAILAFAVQTQYLASLLLLLTPPTLTAHWTGPKSAVITWQSDAQLVCLYRETKEGWGYFLGCWRQGSGRVELPGPPPQDWTHFPRAGDTMCADFDQQRVCVPIVSPVWLPVVGNGVERSRVWLPLVRQE
jgi:hypothetical protein